ncbi:MAG: DNA gyrase inhibitor YacG [Acetobacter sp.]|uniref:DNA gyrase inhibitor YacG n=1 Tax=unclassified Acetobacter TaxID=2628570 RepID=UPI0025BAE237|nr:DNA gyrase inhibitor YacG [Acetobacter sp. UBA5411]
MAEPRPCPICKKPSTPEFRPFCSRRCADIDLGRWFSEDYRVPAEPVSEDGKISDTEDDLPA